MSRRYFDDRNNRQIPAEECSTFRLSGPIRSMIGRAELHLDKPNALALARWLGFELARPEGMEADLDARRSAIQHGTAAKGRGAKPTPKSKGSA